MTVAGLILAHGKSSRFGREKAAAMFDGAPLMLHAARALKAVTQSIAVNARPGSRAAAIANAQGWPVLQDIEGDADGPLAGIKAGLIWAKAQSATHLAVTPCDSPLLLPDLYPRLIEGIGEAPAAAPCSDDGVHPLTALWRTGALPLVERALHGGAHPSVREFLTEIGAKRVTFADPWPFADINTLDDLERLMTW